MAGGTSSTIYGAYSIDGITWTTLTSTQTGAASINGIGYNSVRPNTITFPRNILVGVGSYSPAIIATSTASSIAVTTGVLTVGGTLTGVWQVGLTLTGTGVPANTVITALISGTGGAGTYQTNTTTAVASTSIAGLQASTTAYSTDGGLTWTPGTGVFNFPSTPSSINSWGLCVAYNGYMWVAGGGNNQLGFNTTVALAYSYDGINWTAVPNSSSTTAPSFILSVKSICWSPVRKIWIAVGFDTKVAYSYDGITWTFVTGPSIYYLLSVSWGKDKFIASGGLDSTLTNDIAYSYTGLSGSWVLSTNPLTGTGGIFSTLYNGTMWVGVGSATNGTNGAIYSYDGITWLVGSGATFSSYEGGSTTGGKAGTAWNGSRWVITTGSTSCTNPVFYSDNGINWTQSTTTAVFTGTIGVGSLSLTVSAITSGTILIGQIITGTNILTSTVITSFGTGTGGTGTYNISLSPTSAVSTTITGTLTAGGTCAVWTGNRFIVGLRNITNPLNSFGLNSTTLSYMTSPDGIVWTSNAAKPFTSAYGIAGAVNQQNPQALNVNVAIQQPTLAFGSGTNTIAYSYDGIVWRGLGITYFSTIGYNGCWNGKLWVAVGQGTNTIAYSYDGINWTGVPNTSITSTVVLNSGRGVAWNGTVFVVVGTNSGATTGVVLYSYDGLLWYQSSMVSGNFPTTVRCVAWGQNYFVLGGNYTAGGNTMAYSTNGISWTGLGTTQFGTALGSSNSCNGIICGGNRWVAVGGNSSSGIPNNTIYYATNPTSTWTLASGPSGIGSVSSVTFGVYPVSSAAAGTTYGTAFVATGGSTSSCFWSLDGITWTSIALLGSNGSTGLTWNGKRFIAACGSAGNIMQYSYNPTAIGNWYTAGVTPTMSQLFSTSINGLASSAWPTLGSVYVDNAVTTSSSSGLNTNNQLDIYSDTYFNNGYTNMALTVKATQIP